MDERHRENWTKTVAGTRPAQMSCCALALIFSAPFRLLWRLSAQPVNPKKMDRGRLYLDASFLAGHSFRARVAQGWAGSASSQPDQELAVFMVGKGSASSLLIRSLQLLLSGEAALVTDLIKSSQFHLAREAVLAADLMRRSQFQLPREAAQAAHLIRSFRFG